MKNILPQGEMKTNKIISAKTVGFKPPFGGVQHGSADLQHHVVHQLVFQFLPLVRRVGTMKLPLHAHPSEESRPPQKMHGHY